MASKSKSRRRVFRASCILAALIVAGSSFAWFTSKDEVTNRLSASANYGVSIVEDFTPEENWLPGQKVNKDVSVVNTGNVDAFVRTWLQGEMDVIAKNSFANSTAVTDAGVVMDEVTDPKFTSIGLTFTNHDDDTIFYKELSNVATENPDNKDSGSTDHDLTGDADPNNVPARFTEVQSVQAGGYLVYAPNGAKYSYKLEQAAEIEDSTGEVANYPKDTIVYTSGATGTNSGTDVDNGVAGATDSVEISGVATDGSGVTTGFHAIDTDTFVPETKGVYIFRRNVALEGVNTEDDYEYSGYYYDGNGHYFALYNDDAATSVHRSDYVLPDSAVSITGATPSEEPLSYAIDWDNVKLFTAQETIYDKANNLNWDYHSATAAYTYTPYSNGTDTIYMKGTYFYTDVACTVPFTGVTAGYVESGSAVDVAATGDRVTFDNGNGISIDVELDNIGDTAEEWTVIGSGEETTFYYNNDVEEGDTTSKLIDSMTLSSGTTKDAYLAFDFDLNVFMESIQVTKDESGEEGFDTVSAWAATGTENTAATGDHGTGSPDGDEIALIEWT